jgi:hypothetical protein
MSAWSQWLNDKLRFAGRATRPSPQEERILQLAEWIEDETVEAKPAKEAGQKSAVSVE